MRNKKIIFGMFVLLVMIISLNLVSAGCCQELKDGSWCQNVDESKCEEDSKFAPTVCSSTSFCTTGTCINSDTGKCMINTPQSKCVNEGGVWKKEDPQEIPACQSGCCLYGGDQVSFVNKIECKQIASDHGVNVNFRGDITSQTQCFALANAQEEGACVIENEYETTCLRTTKKECLNKKDNKGGSNILGLFDFSSKGSNVKVDFYPGYLCTAEELNTDCAPTENTRCYEDKAYFVDSCGNLANVYDETMFPMEGGEQRDYWTEIQEPECNIEGTNSNSCGDCDYKSGTICATYDKNDQGMPDSAPQYGNKVCRDLACYYDTDGDGNIGDDEVYEHGESWCAETKGTYHHLPLNVEKGSQEWEDLTSREGITEKYNVPGSRYVKLECRNGKVLEQPCKDYRNSVCMEQILAETPRGDGDYTQASCISNDWRTCFNKTNRNACENSMCKWIEGYRFDFENVKENDEPLNYSEQGSCVPLFSPGFNFWNSSGTASQGLVRENVIYEMHWTTKRNRLTNESTTAAQKCYSQGCYAIPGYGSDISKEEWENIWKPNDDGSPRDYEHLSYRTGHYCHKSDDPQKPKKGGVAGVPECLKQDEVNFIFTWGHRGPKRYRPPIFRSHAQWINSITMRARSLGDVGYKQSIEGYWSDKSSERVLSIIQKLDQNMESKSDMTDRYTMWEGGEYTDENDRMTEWVGDTFNKIFNGNEGSGTIGGGTNTF